MKALLAYWQPITTVAGVLVMLGMNLATISTASNGIDELKKQGGAHETVNQQQAVQLAEQQLTLRNHEQRIASTESLQRADHDAIVKMVEQVNTIAKWVEKQERR